MSSLVEINKTLQSQNKILDDFVTTEKENKGKQLEQNIEMSAMFKAFIDSNKISNKNSGSTTSSSSSNSGGFGRGAMFAGLGAGLAKGGAGLAAMGAAIPLFFSGLLAGSAGLGWLQDIAGLDYSGLKDAAIGFSDIILGMDIASFTVLGSIMAISAVGGTRAAKGLGSMGFAISAFLAGLLAGDLLFEGASALGATFDFANIKAMLVGFSDVIITLDPTAVAALGAVMAGGAIVGYSGLKMKSLARGLGAIGMSMAAIFGGLLAGDLIAEGAQALGGNLDFANIKTMFAGFSDSITALTPTAVGALGAIMAGGALIGYSGLKMKSLARGLGAIGMSMVAIFGGLLAGDLIAEGAQALGANLDFANIKTMFAGFSDTITALTPTAVAALSGIMAAGAIVGYSSLKMKSLGRGLATIGMGIVALFGGLLAGDALAEGAGALGANLDFANIKTMFAGFSDSIGALSTTAVAALSGILTAGAVFGKVSTEADKTKIVLGVGAISASIAAFFAAFAAGDMAIGAMGSDGENIKKIVTAFGDSITALDGTPLTVLGTLIGAGGILGALTVATGGAATAVFAGIPAIGASIAGFFVAFDAVTTLGKWFGADGSSTKKMTKNFADAVSHLAGFDATKVKAGAEALAAAGKGIAVFLGAEGLLAAKGFLETTWTAVKTGFDWLFGTNTANTGGTESTIEKMIGALEPIKGMDAAIITQMDTFGTAIDKFVGSFQGLENINTGKSSKALSNMIRDVGGVLTMMDHLLTGEPLDPRVGIDWFFKNAFGNTTDIIKFGPGLNNLDFNKLNELEAGVNALRNALNGNNASSSLSTNGSDVGSNLQTLYVENLLAEKISTPSLIVNNGGNTSNNSNTQAFSLPGGSAVDDQLSLRNGLLVQ